MLNRKYLPLLVILSGCSAAKEPVFVDLDKVPLVAVATSKTPVLSVKGTSPTPNGASIPGEPSREIENLRSQEKAAIRAEVEKETASAISTISGRLREYYQREIDEFLKEESAKLAPLKQSLDAEYVAKVRAIFESAADKRGPLLTRFVFLTDFPPPKLDKVIPLDGDNLTKKEKERREEIRELQRQIREIDENYERELSKLGEQNLDKLAEEADNISKRVQQKQTEMNAKALAEATQLVRRFSSGLSERIFSRYTFQLPGIATKSVNFPRIQPQTEVPRVPFDRPQAGKEDKASLGKELEAFLSLRRYERVPTSNGARDVTEEFIEWRNNLKSGHWENWQKSSKPN